MSERWIETGVLDGRAIYFVYEATGLFAQIKRGRAIGLYFSLDDAVVAMHGAALAALED